MFRKLYLAAFAFALITCTAQAEPIRTLLTKENKLPELRHADVGFRYTFIEQRDSNESILDTDTNRTSYTPFIRYRATEDLNLFVTVPFVDSDSDRGANESGLGDITVGFELLAFQDIFDYPWVMPHLEANLDTADDHLGQGEGSVMIGLAVGSKVEGDLATHYINDWHFIGDLRYEIFDDSENIASIAGAVIWDISETFSVQAEVELSDEAQKDGTERPVLFLGGLSYKATDDLVFTARGGGGKNSREESIVSIEAYYGL